MPQIDRRTLLASSAVLATVAGSSPKAAAFGRGSSSTITSLTLVNASGTAASPGTVTQLIGLPFKKGDIAPGSWPHFSIGSMAVACTILDRLATRWSDGSLKFVPVMLSIPVSVPGNGAVTVSVRSGGSLPVRSARRLTDFLEGPRPQVQVDGLDNLNGTWVMDLAQGIVAKTKVTHYGNGAAGGVWKVRANAQQNGVDHGQLVCDFYVASLANPDGSLKGFRVLGKVKLPYYDTTAPMNWMSFSRFQLYTGGGTLIRDCFGNNFGPARAYTFAWESGTKFLADSGYTGGDYGYCTRLSSTGSLPGGLSSTTSYFTGAPAATTIGFATCAQAPNRHLVSATTAGSGTHKATPYPYLAYFGALFTAGPSGMWDYVQADGTDGSDTTLRCQVDKSYWVSTGLIPPYDLTVAPASNAPTGYWPNCSEPVTRYLEETGERNDLGIMPTWYARHFLTQADVDETVVRVVSLVGGHGFSVGLESSAMRTHPCVNNGSSGAAYPGMPAPNPQFRFMADGNPSHGFTDTTDRMVLLAGFSQQDSSHMPQFNYYPYLFTGEPWHLDMLLEHANNAVFQRNASLGVANISASHYSLGSGNGGGDRILQVGSNPTRYGITIGSSETRIDAWACALVAAAAAICPDKNPDCPSYKQYFNDMNTATWAAANDILAALPPFAAQYGLWVMPQGTGHFAIDSWQLAYLGAAVALAASATENAGAANVLSFHVKYFDQVQAQFGGWHVASYQAIARMGKQFGAPLVTEFGNIAFIGPNFRWTAGGSFVMTPFRNYTPANGDVVMFTSSSGSQTPEGFSQFTPYYMVNLDGNTFDLSAAPGGQALNLRDSYGGQAQFFIVSSNPPTTGSMSELGAPDSYNSEILGMLQYALAVGASVSPATVEDLAYRNQLAGTSFVSDPKWAMTYSFFQSAARRGFSRRLATG